MLSLRETGDLRNLCLFGVLVGCFVVSSAKAATALPRCTPDSVRTGTVCIDMYEASAWQIPHSTTTNRNLVIKIKQGRATYADLVKAGAHPVGNPNDLLVNIECAPTGQDCSELFAVSLPNVIPSVNFTWFQARAACANSGKRLPSNAEWQDAVRGTSDDPTKCNLSSGQILHTSANACRSSSGAFGMVGNATEWVSDLLVAPRDPSLPVPNPDCGGWGYITDDQQCVPGGRLVAILRGGDVYSDVAEMGPLAISAFPPDSYSPIIGFRCAR